MFIQWFLYSFILVDMHNFSTLPENCSMFRDYNIVKTKSQLYVLIQFCSVQSLSRVRLFATPWITARQASLSITNSWRCLLQNNFISYTLSISQINRRCTLNQHVTLNSTPVSHLLLPLKGQGIWEKPWILRHMELLPFLANLVAIN